MYGTVAFAQNENSIEATKETESVMVTATRNERNLNEIPMTVNVITAEDIKLNPGASVADLLTNIPGITLEENGVAGAQKIRIRGESSGRTLILIDGVRLVENMPVAGAGIVMVSPSDIERIEVIKGPASVLYGSDAIGGVVNIITKKGGGKPFNVEQRMVYDGSSNRFDNFWSAFGSYNGFFYRGSANFVDSDNRKTPTGKIKNSDYKRNTYSGTAGYKWEHGTFSLGYSKFDSKMNYQMGYTIPSYFDWDREVYNADLVLTNITDNFTRMQLSGNWQEVTRDTVTVSSGATTSRDVEGYGVMLQTEWTLGSHYITVGGEYNPDEVTQTQSTRVVKSDLLNASVFIQDEWNILDDTILTLGMRNTWYNTDVTKDTRNLITDRKTSDTKLLGSVGLVYTGFEDISLRGQFSQGYKIPPLYNSTIGGFATANEDLKPEESNNFEVGARMQKYGFDVDWAVFYARAKNYISYVNMGGGAYNYMYVNLDETETFGSELSASYSFGQFTPYANITYMHRTTKFDSTTAVIRKTSNSRTPNWSGNFGLKWESDFFGPRLFTDLNCRWDGKAKSEDETGTTETYNGWATLNFKAGIQGQENEYGIQYFVTLDLNNLFDKEYMPSHEALVMPGRHIVIAGGFTF